ncbi:type III-B CRISPR module-associated protein Cmr5 [Desulfofundulus thermobenzoicus]|nr:type III-B CRISPR module-associated protein Cmr5 [Desulfofundulus thermobenzoicus]
MRTLEQIRAADALGKIRAVQETFAGDEEKADKFASYVESLPATILTNGLGQAAATLLAQAKGVQSDPHYKIYRFLEEWLCRDAPEAPYRLAKDLMEAIVSNDRQAYLHAQAEALAWLEWLKKFAVAFLKKKPE